MRPLSTVETQADRPSTGTRERLLTAARPLFAERGFAATATEEVVTDAGVTRGALYYHFRNKQELFQAVFEEIEEGITRRVTAVAITEASPLPALSLGCHAFLDAFLDPDLERIVLVDAPAVLGWQLWREIGGRAIFGLLALGLSAAISAGEMPDRPVVPLAHLLHGALNEGALFIARAEDPQVARKEIGEAIDAFLTGLQAA